MAPESGQYTCDFGERTAHAIKHTFSQKVTASHKEQMSPWRILNVRQYKNWAHEMLSWTHLSEDLFCQSFPEHRVSHSWSPPWTLFRGCWQSAVIADWDLVLAEVDGQCQFVAGPAEHLKAEVHWEYGSWCSLCSQPVCAVGDSLGVCLGLCTTSSPHL